MKERSLLPGFLVQSVYYGQGATVVVWADTSLSSKKMVTLMKVFDVALVLGKQVSSANNTFLIPILVNGTVGYAFTHCLVSCSPTT